MHTPAFSAPLLSPTWGFSIDLPEDYALTGGDRKNQFSFENPEGAKFDLSVYHAEAGKEAPYPSLEEMAKDIHRRLNNKGEIDSFEYRQKKAFIIELSFLMPGAGGKQSSMNGWALCMELAKPEKSGTQYYSPMGPSEDSAAKPMLLAMAYGPAGKQDLQILHFSALDSIAPEDEARLYPGPITEYAYPRQKLMQAHISGLDISARIFAEDAEAAQALVDREFQVLRRYAAAPNWQDAWTRFYRAIYRDSFDRLADAAFQVERKLNVPPRENREFADSALQWTQFFKYERDFMGSDFVNLVSAATEGRGDCDSRALLWAVVMRHANIPSAIMVSRTFSHAMGLADLGGSGARFELDGQKLLVAETTAKVSIGLIGETVSEVSEWLGISLE